MVEDRKAGEAGNVQTLIDELAAHSSELSALLHETVTALAELVQGRPAAPLADAGAPARPLAPDVIEIATLHAQAAGINLEEYLREAVLAYAARAEADGPAAPGDDRRRLAHEEAFRLRAESEALKAQTSGRPSS